VVETGTGGAGLEPVIMFAQEKRPPNVDELADLGLVGEVGGIEGSVAVGETGPSDVSLCLFALA